MKIIKFKRLLALMMIMCLSFAVIGCKKKDDNSGDDTKTTSTPKPTQAADNSEDTNNDDTNVEEPVVDNASYTYHDAGPLTINNFNPHEWESSDERYIQDYTTLGLYAFNYNEDRDGYVIEPEMAAALPVDVTSQYAGNATYGVPADATESYAFKISLNEGACWENGVPINADTYMYSMSQILNPEMINYRGSSYFSGALALANAQSYYKSRTPNYVDVYSEEGYADVADSDMYLSLTKPIVFFGDAAQTYYNNSGYNSYFMSGDVDLFAKYSSQDYYALTDEAKADLLTIAAAFGDTNPEAYKEFCYYIATQTGKVVTDFNEVGIEKTGEYEITIILEKPITNFNLLYNLSSGWLVYEDLYEANKKPTGDIIKTTYATSLDTYMSYGPYKLTTYQAGKQFILEKNDKWFGYTDGKHDGMWKTTSIVFDVVDEQTTRLQLFLQGKIDAVALTADDMTIYRTSDFIRYTPQSYTAKITFNTDYNTLVERQSSGLNKTMLSYKEFRQAFSLCVDRSEYAVQCTASHKPGFTLLNYLYIYDPDNGYVYRESDKGEKVLLDMYGVSDIDDVTGFNRDEASRLFVKAYEEALVNGDISSTDIIEIDFHTYQSTDVYVKILNFFQAGIDAATAGTVLEGRVRLKMVPDQDYYTSMENGQFDMSFANWGGSSLDPYSITEVYIDPKMLLEYGFKPNEETLTINVNGQDITKTYFEWHDALNNTEYALADVETRLTILAAIELGLLQQYRTIPIYYYNSTVLDSRKIVWGSDIFNSIMGYGGFQYMTYIYNDEEWEAYCKENNYSLQY